METALTFAALCTFFFALVAARLSQSIITPPMFAIAAGLALALGWGDQMAEIEHRLHIIAEITLVIVLFSDASLLKHRSLRQSAVLPSRMLIIGLPLAIGFGFVVNRLLLPDWPVWELALLAAILAPTDAALGQAVVTNPRVPERLRNALTVESGANDGLALPAVLLFASLSLGSEAEAAPQSWGMFALMQIGLGSLIGLLVGGIGGRLMNRALRHGLTNDSFEGIGMLALASLAYLLSTELGGNGFLATFAGGLAFGATFHRRSRFVLEFMETEGQLLVLCTFVLLGIVVAPVLQHMPPLNWLTLIGLSLFVVRPLAIWISLLGTRTRLSERLFMGWFGPRGLATALFAMLVLQDFEGLSHGPQILLICFLTVLISAVLHGVSAAPIAGKFKPDPQDAPGDQE